MRFIEYFKDPFFQEVLSLYESVGWAKYTRDPEGLRKALNNSTYVVVCEKDGEILGLARSISDDIAIHYIQDILVKPSAQKSGIGKQLIEKCLARFRHVRTHLLLTNDEEYQMKFYKGAGLHDLKKIKKYPLNIFIKMTDIDLD